jgi:protoporphyrinogen/coproporphyrinogen III oxidase
MDTRASKTVIVGGGITGLATARAILAAKPDAAVTVLESRAHAGGNLSTEREGEFVIDGGPDSWVSAKPEATRLARSLGLEGELVGTIEKNRRVYVAYEEGLCQLPEGFVLGVPTEILPILKTPLFSISAKIRMGLEPLVPRGKGGDDDESIASFVTRRLGKEVADRLVAPLLGGIYGGDATTLSIRATLPQFVEAERTYGSLVRAMRAQRAAAKGRAAASAFTTLKTGIGTLVDRLSRELGGRIRTGVAVTSIAKNGHHAGGEPSDDGRFVVTLETGEPLFADHVVLAVPPNAAAKLLLGIEPKAAEILGAIPHASTAIVFLALREEDVHRPLDATGYIVPKTLGTPVLASTWVTSKWEGRAPKGMVLLRVFLGGANGEEIVSKDDAELVRLAKDEVRSRMAAMGEPVLTRVRRFERASAQPLVGHLRRIGEVNERLAKLHGLYVAGSGYDGVGIPDCIRQGERAAAAIVGT